MGLERTERVLRLTRSAAAIGLWLSQTPALYNLYLLFPLHRSQCPKVPESEICNVQTNWNLERRGESLYTCCGKQLVGEVESKCSLLTKSLSVWLTHTPTMLTLVQVDFSPWIRYFLGPSFMDKLVFNWGTISMNAKKGRMMKSGMNDFRSGKSEWLQIIFSELTKWTYWIQCSGRCWGFQVLTDQWIVLSLNMQIIFRALTPLRAFCSD